MRRNVPNVPKCTTTNVRTNYNKELLIKYYVSSKVKKRKY